MKKYMVLLSCFLIGMLGLGTTSQVEAANNYSGVWSSYSDIGNYGTNEMIVILKDNGKKVNVEVRNDVFKPLNDTSDNYADGIGKKQKQVVSGSVTFNSKGQASFSYKDKYSNGKMSIQVQKTYIEITWKGTGASDSAFPNGTVKLFKKVSKSQAELKKMSTFLSNFTEVSLNKFDIKSVNNTELIHFGIWHNYINNYNSKISNTKDGYLYISKKSVDDSIYKYFNIQFKYHKTVDRFKFDKKGYTFDGADGEAINYVKVQRVYDLGNNKLRLSGQLYNPDESTTELYGLVEAVVKVQKEKNTTRYVLEKLSVK